MTGLMDMSTMTRRREGIGSVSSAIQASETISTVNRKASASISELESGFRQRLTKESHHRQIEIYKRRAEKLIAELDTRSHIERHRLWGEADDDGDDVDESEAPPIVAHDLSDANEDVEADLHERLCYLRQRHMYCLHCGCSFGSEDDLAQCCPGPHEDDH